MKKPKRPRDVNQLAKLVVDIATGKTKRPEDVPSGKNKKNQEYGKEGGLIGGKLRAEKLSAKKRKEIAQKAANARWKKHKSNLQ